MNDLNGLGLEDKVARVVVLGRQGVGKTGIILFLFLYTALYRIGWKHIKRKSRKVPHINMHQGRKCGSRGAAHAAKSLQWSAK